jgi:hypothetical protein
MMLLLYQLAKSTTQCIVYSKYTTLPVLCEWIAANFSKFRTWNECSERY